MNTLLKRIFAASVALSLAAMAHAGVITDNFSGTLPSDLGFGGYDSFGGTTVSGSFSYDSSQVFSTGNGDSAVMANFDVNFSNGLHATFGDSLQLLPDWSGSTDLLVSDGQPLIINNTFYGFYQPADVTLLDASNAATSFSLSQIAFFFTNTASTSLSNGFTLTGDAGQVNLDDPQTSVGVTVTGVNVANAPEPGAYADILFLALLGLASPLIRRRGMPAAA
jgi:hypothetical protein